MHQLFQLRTGRADAVGSDRDQIGGCAHRQDPTGRADRARARTASAADHNAAGAKTPRRPPASRSPYSSPRAWANGIDHHLLITAQRQRRAGAAPAVPAAGRPSARSASVVGQITTEQPAPPSTSMSSSVRWVPCTTAVRGPSAPASASSPVGVRPVAASAVRVLRGLLGQVHVQHAVGTGRLHHGRHLGDRHRPHGVDPDAHPQMLSGSSATRSAQASADAVREALLHLVHRNVEATCQVSDVEQGEADAGLLSRHRPRASPMAFGSSYRPPPGRVMQVVELADRGVAGAEHLQVAGKGQLPQAVRVRAGRPARTSGPARSRTCRFRHGSAPAARGGRCASGHRRSRAPPGRAAARPPIPAAVEPSAGGDRRR